MKENLKKVVASFILLAMMASLAACTPKGDSNTGDSDNPGTTENDNQGGVTEEKVEAPDPIKEVTSVTIKYNNIAENDGYINVDLSAGSIDLTATVRVKNKCEYTLEFTSSNPDVAEITNEGKVTIKAAGETVITAKAGDKSHSIVLLVSGSKVGVYAISVQGGSADVESAAPGELINLSVDAGKRELFKGWKFFNAETGEPVEDIWVNGNQVKMPECNLIIKADFDVKTYALRVVNASIKNITNEDTEVTFGPTIDGVTTYYVPAGAVITLTRVEEADGETFVGWDHMSQGNRRAGAGEREYRFTMPEEDLSVFAVFGQTKILTFNGMKLAGSSGLATTAIVNGVVGESESADADLDGMTGYRLSFEASSSGNSTMTENLSGVNRFTTLGDGSQTIKILYKNNSNYDVILEFYASQYSTISSTGEVIVPANSIVETFLVANYGFHNPSFGFALRNPVGGSSEDMVDIDMVWELADTYPYGDTSFDVFGAEYVELYSAPGAADYPANSGIRNNVYYTGPIAGEYGGANVTKGSIGGRKNVNNENGITYVNTRDDYTDSTGGTRYIYAKLSNLPEYDPESPTVTVYFRFINTNSYSYTLVFGLGTSTDVNNDETRVSYELHVEPNGTKLFGITIDREQADDIYFSIQMPDQKAKNEYNFSVQMMYNNRIGVKPEDVVSAQ